MRPSLLLLFLLILSSHIIAQSGLKEDLIYQVNYTSFFGSSVSDTTVGNIVIPLTKKFNLHVDTTGARLKSVSYMPENTQPGILLLDTTNNYGPFSMANLSVIVLKLSFTAHDGSEKNLILKFISENSEGDTSIKTPSFLAVSFIKSIAGTEVRDELMDIFAKINYGDKKRVFSMFGADAGINSQPKDSGSNSLMRLNEAVANINFTIVRHTHARNRRDTAMTRVSPSYLDVKKRKDLTSAEKRKYDRYIDSADNIDLLKRVGFIGGGLKVFYKNAYLGAHVGIMEINSKLMGSYLMVGYYFSPYVKPVDSASAARIINKNIDTALNYRHNIYFEAGLNAFGDGVPTIIRSIRFKFGLMLPIAYRRKGIGDAARPLSNDMLYRLAVEVPIGGAFRFR